MAQVMSIVMKLDNGKYRTLDLARVRSTYIQSNPPGNADLHKNGTGSLASPEMDEPDWNWPSRAEGVDGDAEADGNGDPICYWVNGVWICE